LESRETLKRYLYLPLLASPPLLKLNEREIEIEREREREREKEKGKQKRKRERKTSDLFLG
jgi:hypothetical protein